jgi:hypothetical protein
VAFAGTHMIQAMRLTRTVVMLLVCGAVLACPSAAGAKNYAPPGKAGTSEYAETLPAAGGNVAPPANPGSAGGQALSKVGNGGAGARRLEKLGRAGQSAAAFARATAPQALTPSEPVSSAGSSGGSALSGLLDLIGGSDAGGIGLLLPLLLALSLAAALGAGAVRRRHQRDAGA